MTPAIVAGIHLVAVALSLVFYVVRARSLREPLTDDRLRDALLADNLAGMLAIGVYGTGLWRLLGGLEKPLEWYTSYPVFWVKIGLIGLVFVCEIPVQRFFLPLQFRRQRDVLPVVDPGRMRSARLFNRLGVVLTCAILPVAAFMARGVAYGSTGDASEASDVACSVENMFVSTCTQCHSQAARQGGLEMQTDLHAALVGVPSGQWPAEQRVVPGDPERSLLYRKLTGAQGVLGARMPLNAPFDGESTELVEKWIRAGAPRCDRSR